MKKVFAYSLLIFALVFCGDDKDGVFVDGIAAIVGEHIVLKSDVAQLVNFSAVQQRLDPTTDVDRLLLLQQEVIRSIVDQKIMLEMAAVDSIEVEEKEVDRALDQQIEMFVSQAGSEERAEEMLGQSLKSFRREFWYEMKDRLTTERYQQGLINKINIGRNDVEQFFATYKDSLPLFPALVKMRHLPERIDKRRDTAGNYHDVVAHLDRRWGLSLAPKIYPPPDRKFLKHSPLKWKNLPVGKKQLPLDVRFGCSALHHFEFGA